MAQGKPESDKFALWQERNPGGSFKQFYAELVIADIARNKAHPTLGFNLPPEAHQNALRLLDLLVGLGLKQHDTVVDYGCGTLRLGRPLMQHLDADRYVGLDIDERIVAAGRDRLDPSLVALKRPTLAVITPANLQKIAERKPRWVICTGVLHHVPPSELDAFLEELGLLVRSGATAILIYKGSETAERATTRTWLYSFAHIEAAAAGHSLSAKAMEQPAGSKHAMLSLRS